MARIDEIEKAVKAIAVYVKSETTKMGRKVDDASEAADKIADLAEKAGRIEKLYKRLQEFEEEIDKVKSWQATADYAKDIEELKGAARDLDEFKARMHDIEGKVSTPQAPQDYSRLESYIKNVESLAKNIDAKSETASKSTEAYAKSEIARLENVMRAQDFSKLRTLGDELDKKNRELETKLVALETFEKKQEEFDKNANSKLAELDTKTSQKLQMFDKSFDERVKKIESVDVNILNKKIDKLEQEMLAGDIHDLGRRLATLEEETKKLEETRSMLKDESIYRVSIEKRVGDFENKIDSIAKSTKSGLEQEITPVIARRLEEFARALDRKVPELTTKDEFEKFSNYIHKKVSEIESPDITPVERRMEVLEKKIDALTTALRNVLNRMPVIVE